MLTLIILFNINHLFAHSYIVSSITNINNSIRYLSFVGTQLNVFMYSYLTLIILFDINHLFAQSLNSFKYSYFTLGILFKYSYLIQTICQQLYGFK